MALLNQIFNINNLPESTGYEALPTGKYSCYVANTDLKESANTGSEYIALDWEISEGAYRGRHIFQNIIVSHPSSEKAVEMGKMTIRKLLTVGKLNELRDTNQLILMQADLVVSTEQPNEKNGYQAQTKIKDILPHVSAPLPPKESIDWSKFGNNNATPSTPTSPNVQSTAGTGFVSAKSIMEKMGFEKMTVPQHPQPFIPPVQPQIPVQQQRVQPQIPVQPPVQPQVQMQPQIQPMVQPQIQPQVQAQPQFQGQGGPEDFVGDNLDELMASATTNARTRTRK